MALVLCEAGVFETAEKNILAEAEKRGIPVIAVVTKCDIAEPDEAFVKLLKEAGAAEVVSVSGKDLSGRERYLSRLKQALIQVLPDDFVVPPPLLGDLLPPHGLVILIVPIDIEAPKGRLIMPQVQTIRDALDRDAMVLTVKTNEYPQALALLNRKPDLVICDSQVVHQMVKNTPPEIRCTTFSILFSRLKGDMPLLAAGTRAIGSLKDHDKVLIAEACSHHAMDDDIGRVKIPRLLKACTGADLDISFAAGRDYPENLSEYKLIVHCGGCMLNRREILARLQAAAGAGVPVTNYGMCISYTQGVLEKVLSPFDAESLP
ncbi:MAG: [Lentisphaeria bacterium]|nr:[FeFe] hydrogenase H-cluster maturation GTPase HydF [Lentisphaeria bacterium]